MLPIYHGLPATSKVVSKYCNIVERQEGDIIHIIKGDVFFLAQEIDKW